MDAGARGSSVKQTRAVVKHRAQVTQLLAWGKKRQKARAFSASMALTQRGVKARTGLIGQNRQAQRPDIITIW